MIRSFTKENFIKVLCERPATIKHLQKPDDKFIARSLYCNSRVFQYVDVSWLTLPVLIEFVKLIQTSTYYSHGVLTNFNTSVLNGLPEKDLRELCKAHRSLITYFSNAPYNLLDLYVEYIRDGDWVDLKDVPERYRTEDMLTELFARRPGNNTIPEESFTDTIVDNSLDISAECINHIPDKFVTRDRLRRAFEKNPNLELIERSMPIGVWDQPLAEMATEEATNIEYIPDAYVTKDMCLKVVAKSFSVFRNIPDRYKDADTLLLAMTSGDMCNRKEDIPLKLLTPTFLIRLAEKDAKNPDMHHTYGIKNYLTVKKIEPEQWLKVLKVCPQSLRHIAKEDQTNAYIDVFFESAPLDIIDRLHQCVNLARIKKEHSPYLVGSTIKLFQDIVVRKMAAKPKKNYSKEAKAVEKKELKAVTTFQDTVGLELTDSEYLSITKKFGQ